MVLSIITTLQTCGMGFLYVRNTWFTINFHKKVPIFYIIVVNTNDNDSLFTGCLTDEYYATRYDAIRYDTRLHATTVLRGLRALVHYVFNHGEVQYKYLVSRLVAFKIRKRLVQRYVVYRCRLAHRTQAWYAVVLLI